MALTLRTRLLAIGLALAVVLVAGALLLRRDSSPDAAAAPPAGRWRPAVAEAQDRTLTEEELDRLEGLKTLGYLAGQDAAPATGGVVLHEADAAWDGLNLYTSGHAPEAILMDMDGRVLHRWTRNWDDIYPTRKNRVPLQGWRRARLLPDGGLLAIFEGDGLVRLDRDSNVVWASDAHAHHDLALLPDGGVAILIWEAMEIPRLERSGAVIVDFIVILDADGRERRRIPILEAFENSPFAPLLDRAAKGNDMMHTNTLHRLDGRFAARDPAFREGNFLISSRYMDTVAIVDPDAGKVVWALTGAWRRQHEPSLVGEGSLLLFDNLGLERFSRVLEIDPWTGKVLWSYGDADGQRFYSEACGTAQRLENDNTLVTVSDRGRAFEVTRDGRRVWEFVSPERAGERNELIATLYDVQRLPREAADWSTGETAAGPPGAAARSTAKISQLLALPVARSQLSTLPAARTEQPGTRPIP